MNKKAGTPSAVRFAEFIPVFAVTVGVTLFAVCVPTKAAGQAVEDSAVIRERVEAYLDAWDAHDPSGLGAFFAENADFVMGNLPAARGRQEIREWWRDYFARQEPERRLGLDVHSLRFVAPDVAVISVTTTTGGRDSQGQELPARRFRGTWLWRRQNDMWLIAAMRGLPLEEDRVILGASFEAAEALRLDIRGFVAAYEEAFNTHDPAAVSAFYRDDAEIIVRNSPLVSGRQAIQAWWEAYFGKQRPFRALLIIDEIRLVAPNVALLNITATGTVQQQVADQPTPIRYARATWVLAEESGEWLIAELLVLPSEDDRIVRSGSSSNKD